MYWCISLLSSFQFQLQQNAQIYTDQNWILTQGCTFVCTHHTFFPHQTRWFSCVHMEDRWPGPPGSSVQCLGSTPPQHHCPQACLPSRSSSPCPRQGFRCRSSCWDQSWRLGSPSWGLEQIRERPGIPNKQTKPSLCDNGYLLPKKRGKEQAKQA